MRRALLSLLLLAGCSSTSSTPSDPVVEDAAIAIDTSAPLDATTTPDTLDTSEIDAVGDAAPVDAFDAPVVADAGCPAGPERDVWAWGGKIITSAAERAAFFDFAKKKSIRAVYVESEAIIKGDTKQLESFIAEASARCIAVELLFGRSQWALTKGHVEAINLVRATLKMTSMMKGPKPIGVHFDVEPHTLPEWDSDLNGTANQLLDLYEKLGKELSGSGLLLSVDIPFWLDARNVNRAGTTRPLSEWVIDRVDVATLMDYRDHAAPPDGIIDNAQKELDYASTKKKRVVIGVETLCMLDPELVTFCEEGEGAMNDALVETRAAHGKSAAFGGFAVHHYESWKTLKP